MKDGTIDVQYVSRIEGHGNIQVEIEEGVLNSFRWEIPEAPRFFEAMVRGQPLENVAHISSRICGICSIAHVTAALRALEAALGITPSDQTVRLRKLLLNGETIQSHVLHVGYLAAPDFLGLPSVLPLIESHQEIALAIIRLHRVANEWCDLIGGRTTHPVTPVINGWTRLPTADDLADLRQRITDALPDFQSLVDVISMLEMPDFARQTEFLALKHPEGYAFYQGEIASTDGGLIPEAGYRGAIGEFVVPHSTAKRTRANRASFAVGALARYNNNHEQLHPRAKTLAQELGLQPICHNPFMNNVAQVVEIAHVLEDSQRLIDTLLEGGIQQEDRSFGIRAGTGVGAVEAPRGTLYHEYTLDETGHVVGANMIVPTGENHQNIEDDIAALVPQVIDLSQEEIRLMLEMLVRSYDPCVSCSTHLLRVEFL